MLFLFGFVRRLILLSLSLLIATSKNIIINERSSLNPHWVLVKWSTDVNLLLHAFGRNSTEISLQHPSTPTVYLRTPQQFLVQQLRPCMESPPTWRGKITSLQSTCCRGTPPSKLPYQPIGRASLLWSIFTVASMSPRVMETSTHGSPLDSKKRDPRGPTKPITTTTNNNLETFGTMIMLWGWLESTS